MEYMVKELAEFDNVSNKENYSWEEIYQKNNNFV